LPGVVIAGLPDPDPAATCVVTGASSGIGAAIARKLAARGYGVSLVARREDRLRALAQELAGAHGIRAEVIACDLADAAARQTLQGQIDALGLRVDVLVNNAGFGSYGSFVELDRQREVEQVAVMCEAVVDLCSMFVPAMAVRASGAVLIVSSASGFQPAAGYTTYGASKAFSIAFGQALHSELRRSRVAVTTVCPGPVETDFFEANHARPVRVPKRMWQTADAVARFAIRSLARNRRVAIPGAGMRALMAGSRVSPSAVQLRVMNLLLRDGHEGVR
jgi:short-subunit dehydrogenase